MSSIRREFDIFRIDRYCMWTFALTIVTILIVMILIYLHIKWNLTTFCTHKGCI